MGIGLMAFLYLNKTHIFFSGSYNSRPDQLIKTINKNFPDFSKKKWAIVFVFNNLPSTSSIETIEKLHYKMKDRIDVLAFFLKKFNYSKKMKFPHHFSRRLDISYEKNGSIKAPDKNFYVILNNNRINYIDSNFDFFEIAFLLQNKINPGSKFQDYVVDENKLKQKIIDRLNKGNLRLSRLNSGEYKNIDNLLIEDISKIYFIHSNCSICQLKSLFSKLRIEQIFNRNKSIIIFSVMADTFSLEGLTRAENIDFKIYVDTNDEFDLFSIITDEKKNPIMIDSSEIKGGNSNE